MPISVAEFMKQTNNSLEAIMVLAGDGTLAAATAITIKEVNYTTDVYLVTRAGDPVTVALATGAWPDECGEREEKSVAPALNLSVHPSTRAALLKHCQTTPLCVNNKEISGKHCLMLILYRDAVRLTNTLQRRCKTDEYFTETLDAVRLTNTLQRRCKTDEYSTETPDAVRLKNTLQRRCKTDEYSTETLDVVRLTNTLQRRCKTDEYFTDAMRFMFERLKIVVDENSAACVAALFTERFLQLCDSKDYRRVGVMLTGGNCNLQTLPFLLANSSHDSTTCRNT
ncbi:hypothetical protein ACHWQZ_G014683 [Mnemiopsis leidyi]